MASRVLIISTSREMAPQPTVPIGAAWVAQSLHDAGFEVRLLDLCFQKEPQEAVEKALRSFRPEGIGISIRNLDNCDFLSPRSFLPEVKKITDLLKSLTSAPVLLGGAGVSIMPLQVLEYLDLDYAVVGEGEVAAPLFFGAKAPEEGCNIPGVVSRKGGQNQAQPSICTSIMVPPRPQRWVDVRDYLKLEPVLPVQGKRGCANRCLYCTYNRIEGGTWRLRDSAAVAEEIAAAMRETGAREFEFVDSVFNEPEGYLEALLDEILKRDLRAAFRVSSLTPRGLTKAQVRLMERAGVTSLVITPESACNATLAALNKNFTEEEIRHAADLLSQSSIKALWCFLMGGPQEEADTLLTTIDFMNRRIPKKDFSFITTGIRIYPATQLYDLSLSEGVISASDDLLMPKFYFSHRITPQQAKDLLQKNVSDLSRCIFLSDTQLDSVGSLRRVGTMLGLPSPFWRYAGYMNRVNARSRIIRRNWSTSPALRK